MKLPLFSASFKASRMSTIIYCAILIFYGILIMSAFLSVEGTLSDPFSTNNGATITEVENGVYNLTWETQAGVRIHIAMGLPGNISFADMLSEASGSTEGLTFDWGQVEQFLDSNPDMKERLSDQGAEEPKEPYPLDNNGTQIIYIGEETYVRFSNAGDSGMFVVALIPDDGNISNVTIKGPVMLGNLEVVSAFDEYIKDNPFVEGIMGGEIVDYTTVDGYISMEYFSMWPLFLVIFIAIKTAGLVSKHVEDRSMDILLATGYSRSRFLNEKMLLMLVNLLMVLISAYVGLFLGCIMIGKAFPWTGMTLSLLDSIPMAIAFVGLSLLVSVLTDEGGKAVGMVMGLVIGEYIILIVANLASWGKTLKWLTLFSYSDNYGAMVEHTLDPVNVIVPILVAAASIALSYFLFKRKEIPA